MKCILNMEFERNVVSKFYVPEFDAVSNKFDVLFFGNDAEYDYNLKKNYY